MAARRRVLLAAAVLMLALAAAVAAGCGGDDGGGAGDRERAQQSVTVWILENQPDRVRAAIANVAALTRATGIKVRLVGIGDDQLASRFERARVESTSWAPGTCFAGRAAMIFWSPFLLDAMAGLRDDAVPTCPQCKQDPAYLARNSGLVGALGDGSGPECAQYGSIATWGIVAGSGVEPAKRFVAYMLSDGYARWLALSPQGKYPVRPGDASDPERFARQWAGLRSGVERKAPLERFYSDASIESLGEGVRSGGAGRSQEPLRKSSRGSRTRAGRCSHHPASREEPDVRRPGRPRARPASRPRRLQRARRR